MDNNNLTTYINKDAERYLYKLLNSYNKNFITIFKKNNVFIGGSFPVYVISEIINNYNTKSTFGDIDIYTTDVCKLINDLDALIDEHTVVYIMNYTINYIFNNKIKLQIITCIGDENVLKEYDTSLTQVGYSFKHKKFICTYNFINSMKSRTFYVNSLTANFRKRKIKKKMITYFKYYDLKIIKSVPDRISSYYNTYFINRKVHKTGSECLQKTHVPCNLTHNIIFNILIKCQKCNIFDTFAGNIFCIMCMCKIYNYINNSKSIDILRNNSKNIHIIFKQNSKLVDYQYAKYINKNNIKLIIEDYNTNIDNYLILSTCDNIETLSQYKDINIILLYYNSYEIPEIIKTFKYIKFINIDFKFNIYNMILILQYISNSDIDTVSSIKLNNLIDTYNELPN
jgi:hypothetical protein